MMPPETNSTTMDPNEFQKLSTSDYDGNSTQLRRQGARPNGQKSTSVGPLPRSSGPTSQNMHMQMGYGYPPYSQPFMYQQTMAYQHQGQHVAPRQLPPYVSGLALPLRQGPKETSKARSASPSPTAAVGEGWGGLPLASSDDEQEQHNSAVDGEGGASRTESGVSKEADGSIADQPKADDDRSTARDDNGTSSAGTGKQKEGRNRRDTTPCAFFLKTGSCAYGDRCKFEHPYEQAPKVIFNSLGLPLRPEEPPCSFYLKNFRCAFGHTCKYNHPEPPGQLASSPPMVPMVYPLSPPMATMQYTPVHYQPVQAGSMAPMHQHMQAMGYYPAGMGVGNSAQQGGAEIAQRHRGGPGPGQRPQSSGRQYAANGPVQGIGRNQMYDMRSNGHSGYAADRGGQRYDGAGGGMPYGPRPMMNIGNVV